METIVKQLNEATEAYDNGTPIMSDRDWDKLYYQLIDLENEKGYMLEDSPTHKIIFSQKSKLEKVKHNHPMLSLDKTKDINEVKKFVEGKPVIYMEKLDGLTVSLTYSRGRLVGAETRGDGEYGEDVLHNVMTIKNVPKVINYLEDLVIDGEVICPIDTFEKHLSKEYKNPRNYAAGALRRLDATKNLDGYLSFVAWDVIKGFEDLNTLSQKIIKAGILGFETVGFQSDDGLLDVQTHIDDISSHACDLCRPIDGVVIKYDNVEYYHSLGYTAHHFCGGLAYKFFDELYDTKLLDIQWEVSRNKILAPVAIFEPVEIEGSVVSRATLHNLDFVSSLSNKRTWYRGLPLKVYKSNMIIPKIAEVDYDAVPEEERTYLPIPATCPSCGSETVIKDGNVCCENPNCSGSQIQAFVHYCSKKGMDIKGLSKKTIEKLVDWGWLSTLKDIYTLNEHRTDWVSKEGFGAKSVDNILSAIEESKNIPLYRFISALGIPNIGVESAKVLENKHKTYKNFRSATDFSSLDGFGEVLDSSLKNFDYTLADEIANLLSFDEKEEKAGTAITDVFCITGKIEHWKNREELKSYIESLGGKVVSAISSKVNYLINNDKDSTSAKNTKAKELGIPILSENEFIDYIKKF